MYRSQKTVSGKVVAVIAAAAGLLFLLHSAHADTPDRPGFEVPATEPPAVPPTQSAALANHVDIDNFDFAPMTLTVTVGTQVTWTNHDDIPHTVVSADTPPAFKSPALDTDDSFSVTFSKPGTYSYFCSVHPKMVGTIVVKAN
ncbi:MAG TPA: plastocyanin/azurin family copper-binding protein [Terriglobales bacterium]|nr:plastocyanin/azurin family copper-binding protein [Terriglobales bacterium]